MTKFSKIILFILITALSAWLLPWSYRFATVRPDSYPFTLYSPIVHSFAFPDYANGKVEYKDVLGRTYSEHQFDSILPTFYYRQLLSDGRLPATIEGIPVDGRSIQREYFIFRSNTTHINTAKTPLYPLLEAMPERVDLEMPDDVFRMTDRMEFVEMATNRIREEKSGHFTRALQEKGFTFPARIVAGNPTARKDYDEGYLITDRNHRLFHVKKLRDRPYVRPIEIPVEIHPQHLYVTEYPGRHYLGFLTDDQNRFYVLESGSYKLQQLPIPGFAPQTEDMMIIGDAFYWTIRISGKKSEKIYAVNPRNYNLQDSLNIAHREQVSTEIAQYLFPFQLSFTSYEDRFVTPRISDISYKALVLNFGLAVICLLICPGKFRFRLKNAVILCILGLFGLIPLFFRKK